MKKPVKKHSTLGLKIHSGGVSGKLHMDNLHGAVGWCLISNTQSFEENNISDPLAAAAKKVISSGANTVVLVDYRDGKIEQLEQLLSEKIKLIAIPWNQSEFNKWRKGRKDTHALRSEWALYQAGIME